MVTESGEPKEFTQADVQAAWNDGHDAGKSDGLTSIALHRITRVHYEANQFYRCLNIESGNVQLSLYFGPKRDDFNSDPHVLDDIIVMCQTLKSRLEKLEDELATDDELGPYSEEE